MHSNPLAMTFPLILLIGGVTTGLNSCQNRQAFKEAKADAAEWVQDNEELLVGLGGDFAKLSYKFGQGVDPNPNNISDDDMKLVELAKDVQARKTGNNLARY